MNTVKNNHTGFTLVEMAVVLVIVGLLLGGLLMPFSMQMEQRQYAQTQKIMEEAKEALLGFAMANGRLPCPATAASNGIESPVGGGACTNNYNGFLPAVTLGIGPVDTNGFAVDGFGGLPVNRIRYAVSNTVIPGPGAVPIADPFTTVNGIRNVSIPLMGAAPPLIYVCDATPTDALPYDDCFGANELSKNAAFIIYSVGKNAATGGLGADEIVNPNPQDAATGNDPVFVSHPPTPLAAANGEFDDILLWVSSSTLVNKLVSAGQLP